MIRHIVILAAALTLSACGNDPGSDEDGSASGEVLEGSISDAMLPLDTVQSQSPPLEVPRAEASDADDPDTDEPVEVAEEAEPAPEADEPAPEE
ncbi:MAG: hypothetical protein WBH10_07270 [Allopontixanthobacter sediminis]